MDVRLAPAFIGHLYDSTEMAWLAYGKCSKIWDTFLTLLPNKMLVMKAGMHTMLVRIANREDPDRSSLIWVCTVCLGSFGRKLVFKNLKHLP